MADPTKHLHFNGGSIVSDIKNMLSIIKTKKTVAFAYGFIIAFVAFTVFLAFNPSAANFSSPFTHIFNTTTSTSTNTSSIFSYFFPDNSSKQNNVTTGSHNNSAPVSKDFSTVNNHTQSPSSSNQTASLPVHNGGVSSENVTAEAPSLANVSAKNQTSSDSSTAKVVEASKPGNSSGKSESSKENSARKAGSEVSKNGTNSGGLVKQGMEEMVKSLVNCNLFDGHWIRDDSYPLYKPGSCSVIDDQFRCINNGRPDREYQKMKWKPKGCTLPRINGAHLLELIRGKRLVFVGDSLNRNMWESLICILRSSLKNPRKAYEASGRVHFRGEASYKFIFEEYKCTVEFYVSPFLVREWETPDKNGKEKDTLRLDLVGKSSDLYKDADFIIFNTGHWWTHDKTSKGKDYYQEGSHIYGELNVLEAFRKALTTWARWIDANVNPAKSMVFFRGYSAAHFSGGQWNSGGSCDHETEPIKNDTFLKPYPSKMKVLERVLRGMKTHVSYLNITRLTDYRKDGHPSIYRKGKAGLHFQDCSHWCLPGVPDAWNELFYAELLVKQYQRQQQQQKKP